MSNQGETPAMARLDDEGRVAENLACLQCGYNLRTLHHEAKCPECSTAVWRSLRGTWLRYSDPGWLMKLSSGLELIFWMIALLFALMILAMFAVAIASSSHFSDPTIVGTASGCVAAVILLVAELGLLIGIWRLTTPEPNRAGRTAGLDLRRLIRLGVGVFLLTIPADMIFRRGWPAPLIVGLARLLSVMCCNAALLLYLRRLALRIPNEKEARAAKIALIWFCIGIAVTFFGSLPGFTPAGLGCTIAIAGCVDTAAILLFVLLLNRFRRILSDIAEQAK